MFDGSTYCKKDDSAALVDGGANGYSNTSPSDLALRTLLATVLACEDEFVGIGADSLTIVDAFGVRRLWFTGAAGAVRKATDG
nr:hypothetical protein [Tanacetum cinerariifolium]